MSRDVNGEETNYALRVANNVAMLHTNRQSEEIIQRYLKEQAENDKALREDWCFFLLPQRDSHSLECGYWSLLTHWIDQLYEARDRGLTQYTIAFDKRPGRSDPILKLVLEAACHHIGWNHWYYTLRNPRTDTSDEPDDEDYAIDTKAVTPLAELTVYFH